MAELFICKRGELTRESVKALRAAGVVVVEAANPDACIFLRSTERVTNDDMLWAAMKSLNLAGQYSSGSAQRENFTRMMLELIEASRAKVPKEIIAPILQKQLAAKK